MKELRFKQSVTRLSAHLIYIIDIIKEVVKRNKAFPIIVAQVKIIYMMREEGFIHIQITDSHEFIFQDPFQYVIFLFPFSIVKKDAVNITGKPHGPAAYATIYTD